MIKILVDSSFYIASLLPEDSNHESVKKIVQNLNKERSEITTEDFLKEALTIISQRLGRKTAIDFYERLLETTYIAQITSEHFQKGLSIFLDPALNKNISLIDCIASIVYNEIGVDVILTFDRHFQKLDLKVIP